MCLMCILQRMMCVLPYLHHSFKVLVSQFLLIFQHFQMVKSNEMQVYDAAVYTCICVCTQISRLITLMLSL